MCVCVCVFAYVCVCVFAYVCVCVFVCVVELEATLEWDCLCNRRQGSAAICSCIDLRCPYDLYVALWRRYERRSFIRWHYSTSYTCSSIVLSWSTLHYARNVCPKQLHSDRQVGAFLFCFKKGCWFLWWSQRRVTFTLPLLSSPSVINVLLNITVLSEASIFLPCLHDKHAIKQQKV